MFHKYVVAMLLALTCWGCKTTTTRVPKINYLTSPVDYNARRDLQWPMPIIPYYIDANLHSSIDADRFVTAVIEQFEAWNGLLCSNRAVFVYAGRHPGNGRKPDCYDVCTAHIPGAIYITVKVDYWDDQITHLGITDILFDNRTLLMKSAVISINAATYIYPPIGQVASTRQYDLRQVISHEVGHAAGLIDHLDHHKKSKKRRKRVPGMPYVVLYTRAAKGPFLGISPEDARAYCPDGIPEHDQLKRTALPTPVPSAQ